MNGGNTPPIPHPPDPTTIRAIRAGHHPSPAHHTGHEERTTGERWWLASQLAHSITDDPAATDRILPYIAVPRWADIPPCQLHHPANDMTVDELDAACFAASYATETGQTISAAALHAGEATLAGRTARCDTVPMLVEAQIMLAEALRTTPRGGLGRRVWREIVRTKMPELVAALGGTTPLPVHPVRACTAIAHMRLVPHGIRPDAHMWITTRFVVGCTDTTCVLLDTWTGDATDATQPVRTMARWLQPRIPATSPNLGEETWVAEDAAVAAAVLHDLAG